MVSTVMLFHPLEFIMSTITVHGFIMLTVYLYNIGIAVARESLDEVAEVSGVLNHDDDYLPAEVRQQCEAIVLQIGEVKSKNAAETFLFLKAHYMLT
jgi:uncharacterized secreted protein with C-terminal beta-propeller domain